MAQINSELDRTKRIALYKQAQQIMIDRGPVIVPFFETAAAGTSANLAGVKLAPDWSRTLFRTAYLASDTRGDVTEAGDVTRPG